MRIVVIGEGKVGFTLTRELSREGHDLLVIDNRKDALVQVEERLDVMVLEGNGASVKVQQAAEVGKRFSPRQPEETTSHTEAGKSFWASVRWGR